MKAPDVIYLQWHGDAPTTYFDEDDNEVPIPECEMGDVDPDDVTWCVDRIYDADIEYVRSGRYREIAELRELAETLIHSIEIDHDYGCECSACRAIAEHGKVVPEATILQEKDTHFDCKEDV